ncbi:MAG: hypothetical protein EOO38_21570, partial [Cytophagaceae bacterium]
MMDLSLLLTWLAFLVVGFVAPFVWGLGYVWVDVLTPHRISYSLLNTLPIAFITGAGSLLFYLMLDRKNPPKLTLEHGLIAVLGVWITLTQTWALYPIPAWTKWDPSFKVLVFTFFIPFLFRSRVQIEAYVLVLIMSAAGHLLPWGLKTLVTGLKTELNSDLSRLGIWYDDLRRLLAHIHLSTNQINIPDFHELYETFLSVYDPKTRFDYGAFYTPRSLAYYTTNLVKAIIADNLPNLDLETTTHKIIDPCCGTGTFIEAVLEKFKLNSTSTIIGFEILPAPYALAHYR